MRNSLGGHLYASLNEPKAGDGGGGSVGGAVLGWLGLGRAKTEVELSYDPSDDSVTVLHLPRGVSRPFALEPTMG